MGVVTDAVRPCVAAPANKLSYTLSVAEPPDIPSSRRPMSAFFFMTVFLVASRPTTTETAGRCSRSRRSTPAPGPVRRAGPGLGYTGVITLTVVTDARTRFVTDGFIVDRSLHRHPNPAEGLDRRHLIHEPVGLHDIVLLIRACLALSQDYALPWFSGVLPDDHAAQGRKTVLATVVTDDSQWSGESNWYFPTHSAGKLFISHERTLDATRSRRISSSLVVPHDVSHENHPHLLRSYMVRVTVCICRYRRHCVFLVVSAHLASSDALRERSPGRP